METYRDFIAHHGVSGMKWGVWNEETRARYTGRGGRSASRARRIDKNLKKSEIAEIKGKNKKSEKLQKKAAYLKELEEPGSTSLNTKFLEGKRLKNIAGALYGGASVITNIQAAVTGPLAIPLYSAAWGPVAGPMVGVGLAVVNAGAAAGWTKVTMDSLKRAGELNTTITNRKKGKQTSKKVDDSSEITKKASDTKSSKTADKQAKMQRAKKDGMYDVGFMDAIQNTQMFYNEDWNAINKAYSKYLDDPQGFWETRSRYKQAD